MVQGSCLEPPAMVQDCIRVRNVTSGMQSRSIQNDSMENSRFIKGKSPAEAGPFEFKPRCQLTNQTLTLKVNMMVMTNA